MSARHKQPLFQVNVETREGILAVGPAMMKEACEQFASTIAEQIRLGREKKWSSPQVIPLIHLEH